MRDQGKIPHFLRVVRSIANVRGVAVPLATVFTTVVAGLHCGPNGATGEGGGGTTSSSQSTSSGGDNGGTSTTSSSSSSGAVGLVAMPDGGGG
jgi:hypothetical protein